MRTASYIQIDGLSLSVTDFSLHDIELKIGKGEYFVLLGPTGAGKSVLLEAIAGILPIDAGRIVMDGREISKLPPERREIGFVYQDYALFPHLNVEKNIGFGLPRPGSGKKVREDWISEISALLKIDHILERKPRGLSGGEKQRVAMARALAIKPKILLLDEPLSALDPENREIVQNKLQQIHNELGTTTLHITHDFEVAAALADQVGVIMDGRIVQTGSTKQVFRHPVDEKVAQFVGVRNIFRGEHIVDPRGRSYLKLDGFDLATISQRIGAVRGVIRPEDILLSQSPIRASARNNFRGVITKIDERGSFNYVSVHIPANDPDRKNLELVALITGASIQDLGIAVGLEVQATFKASALHII